MYSVSSVIRRSTTTSVQSSGSESMIDWKSPASAIAQQRLLAEQGRPGRGGGEAEHAAGSEEELPEQEHVEGDYEACEEPGEGREPARVNEAAHDAAPAGEEDQRHQRERDPEREDDLADDQRVGRVDADRDHDQRRRQGQGAAQEDRD